MINQNAQNLIVALEAYRRPRNTIYGTSLLDKVAAAASGFFYNQELTQAKLRICNQLMTAAQLVVRETKPGSSDAVQLTQARKLEGELKKVEKILNGLPGSDRQGELDIIVHNYLITIKGDIDQLEQQVDESDEIIEYCFSCCSIL